MPKFSTPHGEFDTSFFAIAEALPQRLLKEAETKPATYSEFWKEDGNPHEREVDIGMMSETDVTALDFILTGVAAHTKQKRKERFDLSAIREEKDGDKPERAYIRHLSAKDSFGQADAVALSQRIDAYKKHLLDDTQYERCDMVREDDVVPGYKRTFGDQGAFDADVLEHLAEAYGGEDAFDCEHKHDEKALEVIIEADTFNEILRHEQRAQKKR